MTTLNLQIEISNPVYDIVTGVLQTVDLMYHCQDVALDGFVEPLLFDTINVHGITNNYVTGEYIDIAGARAYFDDQAGSYFQYYMAVNAGLTFSSYAVWAYNTDISDALTTKQPVSMNLSALAIQSATTFGRSLLNTASLAALKASLLGSDHAVSRSIVTGTGAVGYQASATADAIVEVSLNTTTTASIAGSGSEIIVAEIAPTNSATPTDWVEKDRVGNSQSYALAVTVSGTQTIYGQKLRFKVPAGYYYKLREVKTGTASATINSVNEIY